MDFLAGSFVVEIHRVIVMMLYPTGLEMHVCLLASTECATHTTLLLIEGATQTTPSLLY